MRVFFFNDIIIEICIDSLLNNFGSNCAIFPLFHGLGDGSRLILRAIYDIPDFFFFKHELLKFDPLKSILEASEFLFFVFAVTVFADHYVVEEER